MSGTHATGRRSPRGLTRRAALHALGVGAGAIASLPWLSDQGLVAFTRIQQGNMPGSPRVFTPAQFATLESLVEAIIPADERSPGAKEARVADYIDLLLDEAGENLQLQWIGGLAALDAEALDRYTAPFAKLAPAATETLLTRISAGELDPRTPLEVFFVMAKQATIRGYYTSEIGIHQELRYKGNQPTREFVGCSTEDGADCPHCGQKAAIRHAN
jgi:hypothetical protein